MASILIVYLHIISPYIRRFRKFSYPLEVAVAFYVVDRGIEPLCQDWESCILTIRWIHHLYNLKRAEAGGFEPPVRLPVRQFSKLLVSATHPNFLPVVRCNHRIIFAHLLIADAKVWIYFYSSKLFANFFSLFLHFSCFLFSQRLRKRPSPYYILNFRKFRS